MNAAWNSAANRDQGDAGDGADTEGSCMEPGVTWAAAAIWATSGMA
jgi:hypothetical protein